MGLTDELWDRQRLFTEKVIGRLDKPMDEMTDLDRIEWTRQYLLSIHAEASEVLNCMPWKKHRKTSIKDLSRGNLMIELIDVQKYLWGLMQVWGMTPEEFEQVYNDKSFEVEHRWIQEHELENIETLENIVIIDIDGVLNDYPQCFYRWITTAYGASAMDGLLQDRARYETMKDEYRASGAKRTLPVDNDSRAALKILKRKGIPIVLLTDRPYMKSKRISYDTMAWLDASDIPYDYLFWSYGQSKTHIVKKVKSVLFMIDDKPKTCQQFHALGIRAYLFDPNGLHAAEEHEFRTIRSMFEISEVMS
jgi:FMN phosphatase YigB (HAD superfamily)